MLADRKAGKRCTSQRKGLGGRGPWGLALVQIGGGAGEGIPGRGHGVSKGTEAERRQVEVGARPELGGGGRWSWLGAGKFWNAQCSRLGSSILTELQRASELQPPPSPTREVTAGRLSWRLLGAGVTFSFTHRQGAKAGQIGG